jgi:hypothetical protein
MVIVVKDQEVPSHVRVLPLQSAKAKLLLQTRI